MWDFFKCCKCFKGKDCEAEPMIIADPTKNQGLFSRLIPLPIHTEKFWTTRGNDKTPKKHKKPLIPRLVFINEGEI